MGDEGDVNLPYNPIIQSEHDSEFGASTGEVKAEQVEDNLNEAKGCILGAFIGDSAGAVLEFYQYKITEKDVNNALTFPGGGCFKVDPGQFTDDSEMALGMMKGLLNSESKFVDQVEIAKQYVNWYRSKPFDIGTTTINGVKQMYHALSKGGKSTDVENGKTIF